MMILLAISTLALSSSKRPRINYPISGRPTYPHTTGYPHTTNTGYHDTTISNSGCSDSILFETSDNSFPEGHLQCYSDSGELLAKTKTDQSETVKPGTSCFFVSSDHLGAGSILMEITCDSKG